MLLHSLQGSVTKCMPGGPQIPLAMLTKTQAWLHMRRPGTLLQKPELRPPQEDVNLHNVRFAFLEQNATKGMPLHGFRTRPSVSAVKTLVRAQFKCLLLLKDVRNQEYLHAKKCARCYSPRHLLGQCFRLNATTTVPCPQITSSS